MLLELTKSGLDIIDLILYGIGVFDDIVDGGLDLGHVDLHGEIMVISQVKGIEAHGEEAHNNECQSFHCKIQE